ncbi:MAG TPA: class I tRNA ligase family protein, partial [Candidatus Paceibacterota bacterium]|nr:class I tRNA ligase family protein [Candidatus Paceibacterota bacterium]
KESLSWGIPVPNDPSQTMYVWVDALSNYISALDWAHNGENFQNFWPADVHLIGKDILRFHAMIWPALLLSAGIDLPKTIYVHGFITVDGQKMSKSIGNVIDPFAMAEKYTPEVFRYFLLREIPSGGDGDFSEKKLIDRYNGDLANGLGNLVSRVITLIDKNLDAELIYKEQFLDADVALKISQVWDAYRDTLDNFKLNETLAVVWDLVAYADKYMNDHQPWKQEGQEFLRTMTNLVMLLHNISRMLLPFMPKTAEKIMNILGVEPGIDPVEDFKFSVTKGAGLFPRLES